MKICKGEEDCGGAPVSPKEKRQDDETREDVADSLDPHEGKGSGVVDRNAETSGGPNRVQDEVDANPMIATGTRSVNQKSGEFLFKVEPSVDRSLLSCSFVLSAFSWVDVSFKAKHW
jgi:hypothetical protein